MVWIRERKAYLRAFLIMSVAVTGMGCANLNKAQKDELSAAIVGGIVTATEPFADSKKNNKGSNKKDRKSAMGLQALETGASVLNTFATMHQNNKNKSKDQKNKQTPSQSRDQAIQAGKKVLNTVWDAYKKNNKGSNKKDRKSAMGLQALETGASVLNTFAKVYQNQKKKAEANRSPASVTPKEELPNNVVKTDQRNKNSHHRKKKRKKRVRKRITRTNRSPASRNGSLYYSNNTSSAELDCEQNISKAEGYSSCNVSFDLSLNRPELKSQDGIDFYCRVELEVTYQDKKRNARGHISVGIQTVEEGDSVPLSLSNGHGSQRINMSINVGRVLYTTTRVLLTRIECIPQ